MSDQGRGEDNPDGEHRGDAPEYTEREAHFERLRQYAQALNAGTVSGQSEAPGASDRLSTYATSRAYPYSGSNGSGQIQIDYDSRTGVARYMFELPSKMRTAVGSFMAVDVASRNGTTRYLIDDNLLVVVITSQLDDPNMPSVAAPVSAARNCGVYAALEPTPWEEAILP